MAPKEAVAVLHRKDAIEDKLAIAPTNSDFSNEDIIRLRSFQEQFFDIEVLR
ncbi:MAG: hypothetical protein AAGF53_13780 [Pseudomonadota bacterium]